jgi:hypothetical protein
MHPCQTDTTTATLAASKPGPGAHESREPAATTIEERRYVHRFGLWLVGLRLILSLLDFDETAAGDLPSLSAIVRRGVLAFASALSCSMSWSVQLPPAFLKPGMRSSFHRRSLHAPVPPNLHEGSPPTPSRAAVKDACGMRAEGKRRFSDHIVARGVRNQSSMITWIVVGEVLAAGSGT